MFKCLYFSELELESYYFVFGIWLYQFFLTFISYTSLLRKPFHFFPIVTPHYEILIPQIYCTSVLVLYVYLCFMYKKSKITSLFKNEFHPLTGNILPNENECITSTSIFFFPSGIGLIHREVEFQGCDDCNVGKTPNCLLRHLLGLTLSRNRDSFYQTHIHAKFFSFHYKMSLLPSLAKACGFWFNQI